MKLIRQVAFLIAASLMAAWFDFAPASCSAAFESCHRR